MARIQLIVVALFAFTLILVCHARSMAPDKHQKIAYNCINQHLKSWLNTRPVVAAPRGTKHRDDYKKDEQTSSEERASAEEEANDSGSKADSGETENKRKSGKKTKEEPMDPRFQAEVEFINRQIAEENKKDDTRFYDHIDYGRKDSIEGAGSDNYFDATMIQKALAYPVEAMCNPLLSQGDMLGASSNDEGTMSPNRLWKNGKHASLIKSAMHHIEARTCIRFKQRTQEPDYVLILKHDGCYSYVGKSEKGGMQPLSLGDGCHYVGTVIHELMHAIGFHHEHSRDDRDDHVEIVWNNVMPLAVDQFYKIDSDKYPQFYDFDYNSVMLYGSIAFSRDGKSPTILKTKGEKTLTPVYQKTSMSLIDAKRIRKLYNCNNQNSHL